ncbi:MAG: YebC/PmpR family DNA-binding transcriptional regulator [Firmicutes bacterium]|nr:YebC/PmpR family DNA-binding transcriptional regulator [Bacillota bacterium]
MSGHSKWATIKRHKSKVDAQRGKLFTKIGRELILAARAGGADPAGNMRLKMAITKAREANMPMDNITRAIKRGTGEIEGSAYEEITYEGYGPGGVAIMVSAATDNRNRTAAEIRHIFSKNGGSLGEGGCVAWMFQRKGVMNLDEPPPDEDELLLLALDAGAEDVRVEEDSVEIITGADDFESVREALAGGGLVFARAEVTMLPQNTVSVEDREQAAAILRLMDMLEEHDDVQEVYSNFDIPETIMENL